MSELILYGPLDGVLTPPSEPLPVSADTDIVPAVVPLGWHSNPSQKDMFDPSTKPEREGATNVELLVFVIIFEFPRWSVCEVLFNGPGKILEQFIKLKSST